jgi:hypothetical protein
MNIYSAVLFLHIVGALGFFVVQGLEWIGLSRMRTVRLPEEAVLATPCIHPLFGQYWPLHAHGRSSLCACVYVAERRSIQRGSLCLLTVVPENTLMRANARLKCARLIGVAGTGVEDAPERAHPGRPTIRTRDRKHP